MTHTSDPTGLDRLRGELDRVDDAMHDLLVERAGIVRGVAALRAQGKVAFRPGREAAIIARLLGRDHGSLPVASVVRIWREILAGSLSMQTDFAVGVAGAELCPLAREHFGALTPVREHRSARAALDDLRGGRVTAVLLPWPGRLDRGLLDGLFVVARLPFWCARPDCAPAGQALVIAATAPDPSGNDCSIVAIPGDAGTQIEEIDDFLTPEDPRLVAMGPGAVLLGAYAVPLSKAYL